MAHPGIEHSLGEIHEQVDNEVNHRGEQCDGLYGSVVSCVNRFCDIATDSRPAKDCLGNDSSAEKLSELKPHNCCDGRCRIFQSVYAHDGCWSESLGVGGANVILPEYFEHCGTGHPGDHCDGTHRKHECGPDEVGE